MSYFAKWQQMTSRSSGILLRCLIYVNRNILTQDLAPLSPHGLQLYSLEESLSTSVYNEI